MMSTAGGKLADMALQRTITLPRFARRALNMRQVSRTHHKQSGSRMIDINDWTRAWGNTQLVKAPRLDTRIPQAASEFLVAFGLPRRVIVEAPDPFEIDRSYAVAPKVKVGLAR
jgi:hypothetical protein